jgi:GAF domain-containing protein
VTGDGSVHTRIEGLLLACIAAVGVDGGGMSLVSATGTRQPLYGSDEAAQVMERLQFTVGEGPCVDASASGSPVLVPDIDEPGSGIGMRWPAFLAEAASANIRAVFAFPVRIGAVSLGAIDLYRRSPGPLGREELAKTLTAVDAIAAALLDVAGTLDSGLDIDRVSSMAVHRAAGMVMEQLGTSIENALIRLRAAAYAEGVSVNELANAVIIGTRRFQEEERA